MKHLVAVLTATSLIALSAAAAGQETLTGPAKIVDADTIIVDDSIIRFEAIDAPEMGQVCYDPSGHFACGEQATQAMRAIIDGHELTCISTSRDRFGRAIATCRIGRIDIADELVRQGWAVAYRDYSLEYVPAELEAKAERRGLWAPGITFTLPWEWRRQQQ